MGIRSGVVDKAKSRLRFAVVIRFSLRGSESERKGCLGIQTLRWPNGLRESHARRSGALAGRLVVGGVRRDCRLSARAKSAARGKLEGVRHIFITRGARRDCMMIVRRWGEVNERARALGHARLRTHEHGRVVCAHSIFFELSGELRRKGMAGHRLSIGRAPCLCGVYHTGFVVANACFYVGGGRVF